MEISTELKFMVNDDTVDHSYNIRWLYCQPRASTPAARDDHSVELQFIVRHKNTIVIDKPTSVPIRERGRCRYNSVFSILKEMYNSDQYPAVRTGGYGRNFEWAGKQSSGALKASGLK